MKPPRQAPNKSLQQSLAESLKRAVPSAPPASDTAALPAVPPREAGVEIPLGPGDVVRPARLLRTTVSVRVTEQESVDKILTVLKSQRGHRGGLTEAVSIALRLCPLDPVQIGRVWDAIRAEDGRVKKKV